MLKLNDQLSVKRTVCYLHCCSGVNVKIRQGRSEKPSNLLRRLCISALPVMHCNGCPQLLRGQGSRVELRLDGMQTLLLRPMDKKPWHEAQGVEQSQSPRTLLMHQGLKARHLRCRALTAPVILTGILLPVCICIRNTGRYRPEGPTACLCKLFSVVADMTHLIYKSTGRTHLV